MEAVLLSSSLDKSVSPYKQMKNQERVARGFVSNPIENLAPMNNTNGGLLFAPPPLFSSCPPSASASLTNYHLFRHQQPPLLPLPLSQPLHNSLLARSRSLSSSPTNRKSNRTRDQSLTPKKSKSKPLTSKGEEQKKDLKPVEATEEAKESVIGSGPDPNDLPKNMLKVLSSSPSLRQTESNVVMNDLETFSGSVFTLSPPPSSLPMPKFSLRPKLSCNAEAAEIDAGATDDLRRLLRIC